MKTILTMMFMAACGVTSPSEGVSAQEARCLNCGGDGGGWEQPAAESYVNNYATQTYNPTSRWGLTCTFSEDGAWIQSCQLNIVYPGGQLLIDCTYPADGSTPSCLSSVIQNP